MKILKRLKNYLDKNKVKYIIISHSPAYTAQDIAHSIHHTGKEIAKTVIVKNDNGYAMVVLPASNIINTNLLKIAMRSHKFELATENELEELFPDCPVGAIPPFGNLYNLNVFVSKHLSQKKEIIFNAGSRTDVLKMKYKDYKKLVNPTVDIFSEPAN
jgi:Ala-tRNA(Pro) deacylase